MAKYVKTFLGWQIYVIPEAYLSTPANQLTDRYIAIKPGTRQIIDDVTVPSLEASVREAEK